MHCLALQKDFLIKERFQLEENLQSARRLPSVYRYSNVLTARGTKLITAHAGWYKETLFSHCSQKLFYIVGFLVFNFLEVGGMSPDPIG